VIVTLSENFTLTRYTFSDIIVTNTRTITNFVTTQFTSTTRVVTEFSTLTTTGTSIRTATTVSVVSRTSFSTISIADVLTDLTFTYTTTTLTITSYNLTYFYFATLTLRETPYTSFDTITIFSVTLRPSIRATRTGQINAFRSTVTTVSNTSTRTVFSTYRYSSILDFTPTRSVAVFLPKTG
jgi:hypothetical protein